MTQADVTSAQNTMTIKKVSLAAIMRQRAHEQFQSVRDGKGPIPTGQIIGRSRPRLIKDVNPANQVSNVSSGPLKVAHPLKKKSSTSTLHESGLLNKRSSIANLKTTKSPEKDLSKRNLSIHESHEKINRGLYRSPVISTNSQTQINIPFTNPSHSASGQRDSYPRSPLFREYSHQALLPLQSNNVFVKASSKKVKDSAGEENRCPSSPVKTIKIKATRNVVCPSDRDRSNSAL